jgi:hypothetical protein
MFYNSLIEACNEAYAAVIGWTGYGNTAKKGCVKEVL